MPELPEVETIARQLAPALTGARIERAEVLDPRFARPHDPERLASRLSGRTIESVGRRGKYLLLRLDRGSALVIHLRMTGGLSVALPDGDDLDPSPPALYEGRRAGSAHLRARLVLEGGAELRFTDARRFGHGHLLEADELGPYLGSRLGPEPLSSDFTPDALGRAAAGRRAPLKSFLLDQRVVAGVGNIYADEALHRARLHPLSPAGSMRPEHLEALHRGVVEALEAGLAAGGATIDDYRDATGRAGRMQDEFLVHTREGLSCPRCAEPIRRIVVGGRSTYFCPGCQRRLRRRRRGGASRARRPAVGTG